ncbi:unnamed protein product [Brachionus calyciflorus]|uniref:EF-hand domain-containing protein n=1 Tax=Brachionus calyciflorus TaxID=104777 RepID=A0A813Q0M2_9BILA|nr:unnamed protein product [Brachionus calyciflorus]
MGSTNSVFTPEEKKIYKELTFLNSNEIENCFKAFSRIVDPEDRLSYDQIKKSKIDYQKFKKSLEFKENPFKDRIFKVFSKSRSKMTFEDYLDMMSVFSESCPSEIKVDYAFKIYAFSDSDHLEKEDLRKLITRLIGPQNQMSVEQIDEIIDKILSEADFSKDQTISLMEFSHIVSKSIDFEKTFSIRVQ